MPSINDCEAYGDVFDRPQVFAPGFIYEFSVRGASAADRYAERVNGDGQWIFEYWSIYEDGYDSHQNLRIGSTNAILEPSTFTIYIFFRLYIWSDRSWIQTNTVASIAKQIRNVAITPTPEANYYGWLAITQQVHTSSGISARSNGKFYAGIFADKVWGRIQNGLSSTLKRTSNALSGQDSDFVRTIFYYQTDKNLMWRTISKMCSFHFHKPCCNPGEELFFYFIFWRS